MVPFSDYYQASGRSQVNCSAKAIRIYYKKALKMTLSAKKHQRNEMLASQETGQTSGLVDMQTTLMTSSTPGSRSGRSGELYIQQH